MKKTKNIILVSVLLYSTTLFSDPGADAIAYVVSHPLIFAYWLLVPRPIKDFYNERAAKKEKNKNN